MDKITETGLKSNKIKIILLCTLIIIMAVIVFLHKISSEFYQIMQQQREAELTRLVDIAYNAISPVIEMVEAGQLTKEEAGNRIRAMVRRMTYNDKFGSNYIFMSSYDGTMLVQPFEPEKEGTNQWNLRDARGKYIIRELVEAAKQNPDGSFVEYYYYPPGKQGLEEKLSYVKGLPAIQAYIGTGMYLDSGYAALKSLLKWQRSGLIVCGSVLLLLLTFYIRELIAGKQMLLAEIKHRRLAEHSLWQEKELLSVTLKSIGDGVIAVDKNSRIMLINRVGAELTGWQPEEAEGKPLSRVFNIINEETDEPCENPAARVLDTGTILGLANHTALISREGQKYSIADSAAPIKDDNGELFGVVVAFRDVTEEKKKENEIIRLSYRDSLTGLHNRRYFEEMLGRLDSIDNLPVSVIVGDVNGLKMTNDIFGHESGDVLLRKLAGILVESCRKEDIIARWGGDEFIILLPKTGIKEAEKICERIKKKCDESRECPMQVSISLGYAVKENKDDSIWQVQKEAEDWMYRNKLLKSKSFRNTVIASLKATLFEKSLETEEHAERLKLMGIKLGQAMGLSSLHLDELELLAMLHDIGKIAIKETILSKPGKLSETEWEEMKKHSEIGYRIAQATPELSRIADYILCHHEWWNGKGYPQGLKGVEIPLLSRILSIVDAYDAMTSNRVYRKAMSREAAAEELKKFTGIQFDPELVKVFIDLIYEQVDE
ncbi:cache domain-containing protein [Desulfocucumis palustris]|uniref:cache domain-containing protein n=1 Tax=Desulfocucumis palustris TaxID=1898651 RepID=UPI0013FD85A6|nr:cache domain-containing protein [Desulfocucumis palustris]